MSADRIEAEANGSIEDRLEGNSTAGPDGRSLVLSKRQSEDDDKWKHDLFEDNEPQVSGRRVDEEDLRLKLQQKISEASQFERGLQCERDLLLQHSRAVYASQIEYRPPTMRSNVAKPLRKSVIAQAPAPEKVSSTVSRKKVHQKVRSVQSFLKSLGLDKYLFTFEAEEVDMAALVCMSDDDLKAMGIPMGPRKKILKELESKGDD